MYSDNIALFVKDTVLSYLDSPEAKIREAAAQACCLLYVKNVRRPNNQMISKNKM